MQEHLSPKLRKALEELQESYSLKVNENSQQSSVIKSQSSELKQIKNELEYKDNKLKHLENEILRLKKESFRSVASHKKSLMQEQSQAPIVKEKHKSLLEIHLQDIKYSSDKWEHYFRQYESEFQNYRDGRSIRLLEIGVQNGGSLQCWAKYFGASSEVVGIDIDAKTSFLEYEGSIKNFVGDATNPDWLKLFRDKETDFDIIIDDGSHVNKDIIDTFILLFEKIKPGGVYVCEDLHACYWKSHRGGLPSDPNVTSAIAFFKEIVDSLNEEHWISISKYNIEKEMPIISKYIKTHDHLRALLSSIESIKFSNSIVFIKKSLNSYSELGSRIITSGEAIVWNDALKFAID